MQCYINSIVYINLMSKYIHYGPMHLMYVCEYWAYMIMYCMLDIH